MAFSRPKIHGQAAKKLLLRRNMVRSCFCFLAWTCKGIVDNEKIFAVPIHSCVLKSGSASGMLGSSSGGVSISTIMCAEIGRGVPKWWIVLTYISMGKKKQRYTNKVLEAIIK